MPLTSGFSSGSPPTRSNPQSSSGTDDKSLADWLLRVLVNGKPILEKVIDTEDHWEEVTVDLSRYAGKLVVLTLENAPGGKLEFAYETAYWASAKVTGE